MGPTFAIWNITHFRTSYFASTSFGRKRPCFSARYCRITPDSNTTIGSPELVIGAMEENLDPGAPSLLAEYQRLRRPDNLMMLAMTDGLDRLFSTNNPVMRLARDLGIAAVHRTPAVKRAFMRRAMGH